MHHNLDKALKNLDILDEYIHNNHMRHMHEATITLSNLHETEDLMHLLVARNAYQKIYTEIYWDIQTEYHFSITVVF